VVVLRKKMRNLDSEKKSPKSVGYFSDFLRKLLKVNNHPLGESGHPGQPVQKNDIQSTFHIVS
jgi:hypothetical protein